MYGQWKTSALFLHLQARDAIRQFKIQICSPGVEIGLGERQRQVDKVFAA